MATDLIFKKKKIFTHVDTAKSVFAYAEFNSLFFQAILISNLYTIKHDFVF